MDGRLLVKVFTITAALLFSIKNVDAQEDYSFEGCDKLKPKNADDYNTAINCVGILKDRIQDLEAILAPLLTKIKEQPDFLRKQIDQPLAFPSGAVVMFAKDFGGGPTEPCPPDWRLLQEATGRIAIGAGQPSQKLDAEFVRTYGKFERVDPKTGKFVQVNLRPHRRENDEWLFYKLMETGGAEDVTLTETQMPKHRHTTRIGDGSKHSFVDYSRFYTGSGNGPTVASSGTRHPYSAGSNFSSDDKGSSQPHNNMPPYIALYFCKKD